MRLLPGFAPILLLAGAPLTVCGDDLFHINQPQLTEIARQALREADPSLSNVELPVDSIMIICPTQVPCTALVTIETSSDDDVTREGARCITKTTYTSVQVVVNANGAAQAGDTRQPGRGTRTTSSNCDQ